MGGVRRLDDGATSPVLQLTPAEGAMPAAAYDGGWDVGPGGVFDRLLGIDVDSAEKAGRWNGTGGGWREEDG